jgi:ubiquinone/menaquinone biosynthesis C-methylase UbiE
VAYVDFVTRLHTTTKRNYLERVVEHDKAECAEVALQWGKDYWDGDRRYGYGGYRYDGRWRRVAEEMVRHYGLRPGASILDVGCGKGFLLYEFTQVLRDAQVAGLDISEYAIANAKEEVKAFLRVGTAAQLPFADRSVDLVVSINTLHNLYIYDLWSALREIERVARGPRYVVVEAYRNERQKVNLMDWQLTCRAFHTPAEWEWIYAQTGYTGDYSFVNFE